MREEQEGERVVEIRFSSRPDRLAMVRATVSAAAQSCGCGEACVQDIIIAVSEACQNVIRHAYGGAADGEIVLDIRKNGHRLIFELLDFAPPVDVAKIRPRPLEEIRPGGLGTHYIQECMDQCGFVPAPEGAGNLFRMVKQIR